MLKEIRDLQSSFHDNPGDKIPIFTYAFGDELLTSDPQLAQLPKKIACQNDGIAYQIPDGEPLADVMVDYYKFFSNGLSADDPLLETVRWTEYTDAWTETAKLLAGCMPVYDSVKKRAGQVDLVDESEVKKLVVEHRADDRVTFEVFLPIMQAICSRRSTDTSDDFIEGLRHFDKDGNGFISSAELRHLLTTLGEKLSDEEAEQLLAGHEDNKGNINYENFVRTVMNG